MRVLKNTDIKKLDSTDAFENLDRSSLIPVSLKGECIGVMASLTYWESLPWFSQESLRKENLALFSDFQKTFLKVYNFQDLEVLSDEEGCLLHNKPVEIVVLDENGNIAFVYFSESESMARSFQHAYETQPEMAERIRKGYEETFSSKPGDLTSLDEFRKLVSKMEKD